MNASSTAQMKHLLAVFALLMIASCHTDPLAPVFYGAGGPLVPGLEVRLTYADTNEDGVPFQAFSAGWSSDGGGILYSFAPRERSPGESKHGIRCVTFHVCRPVAADPQDACLAMLPPIGGSAHWNACERRLSHSDVTDILAAGNLNRAGQLLYTQATGPNFAPFPVGFTSGLWIATPENLLSRRLICTLVDSSERSPSLPRCGPMILDNIQWSGENAFVAVGENAIHDPVHQTDRIDTLGLFRGSTSGNTGLEIIPGTAGSGHYALSDGGAFAVFIGSDLSVRRVNIDSGNAAVVGSLLLSATGKMLDVGCHPTMCVVLASDGMPKHWDLWKMDLVTGATTKLRTFDHELLTAKLSPASGDVVALERIGLYTNVFLLAGVVQ